MVKVCGCQGGEGYSSLCFFVTAGPKDAIDVQKKGKKNASRACARSPSQWRASNGHFFAVFSTVFRRQSTVLYTAHSAEQCNRQQISLTIASGSSGINKAQDAKINHHEGVDGTFREKTSWLEQLRVITEQPGNTHNHSLQ